ncbi:uncharacterized protein LOC110366941 [Fundulus heteroclitus]|uniref:uncharacterized protein LOC110366941 n=1 Tax=Fundulus heteroclitus TaxID=8078 RepID=UPI00165BB53D|nr:uncharacterized protein LOC110366941 [Fundulus heteroclitus]
MSFICMIMPVLVLPTLAAGILQCNLTHRDEDKQCYGALGEPLTLHLPDHARMSLKDNNNIILKLANNTLLEMHATRKTCWKFLMNGTFKCDKTTKNSSGVYQLEVYDTDGKINKTISINLQILAPVSHPSVFQTCLSPEQRTISCSTEGDVTQFSFSLDNNPLMQINASSAKKESVTISLNGLLAGNLQCKVQNKVSSKQTVSHLTSCKGPHSLPMTVLTCIKLLIPLLIVIPGIKLLKNRRRPTSIKEDNVEDQTVFSDVRVTQATEMDVKGAAECTEELVDKCDL